ncbi:MAG: AAA domain-containing protein [Gammaproteobacteria bacterium]|nr:AAA domain-containing protein [Gammaproteobacteria bacterium]
MTPETRIRITNLLADAKKLNEENDYLPDRIPLPENGSWPATFYSLQKKSLLAIIAAVATGRPLLIRGEPGVGKSHLARAAAERLGRDFISTVVQPDDHYQDLMWSVDHTARLGDAQVIGHLGGDGSSPASEVLKMENYVVPGPVWQALNPVDAKEQKNRVMNREVLKEKAEKDKKISNGSVLLIDEIDKAEMSFANGLLEVLGNGSFEATPLSKTIKADTAPLVVITTNETRELPQAFIRRCVIHELELPKGEKLKAHLNHIGKVHFEKMSETVIAHAVDLIVTERNQTPKNSQVITGQAELVDLLRALDNLDTNEEAQLSVCNDLASFFFKHDAQG